MKTTTLTTRAMIEQALAEDCPNGDITTELLSNYHTSASAHLISKQTGIFYGTEIIDIMCELANISFTPKLADFHNGCSITTKTIVGSFTGPASTLLKIERTLLNFIQQLSGIATETAAFVTALDDPSIQVLDTRKTLPLYRDLAKQAVKAGGGYNHRWNLSDMILLKENHLSVLKETGDIKKLTALINEKKRQNPQLKAEIEIETYEELQAIDLAAVDIILLDNFSVSELNKSTQWIRKHATHCDIEVSGNVSRETISQYKGMDIDRISVGSITHSAPAFDFSLLFK